MVRNRERASLRDETERQLRELEDADWDETSEVVASAAANAAAKTAHRMSRPDSDAPGPETKRTHWPRTPAGKAGGVVGALAALAGIVELVRRFVEALQ